MLKQVNQTIFHQGFAIVKSLQLLKVDFKQNYEETITNIQLQEQLKVTKNYALDVTRVLKEVDILQCAPQRKGGRAASGRRSLAAVALGAPPLVAAASHATL